MRKEKFSSNFRSIGIKAGSDQVAAVGKKLESLHDLEEMNLSLRMESVELRRLLEVVEEEKRHMCLQLQHVLEEQVESSTPKSAKNSSKAKPICGHGPNIGHGPYVENDAF